MTQKQIIATGKGTKDEHKLFPVPLSERLKNKRRPICNCDAYRFPHTPGSMSECKTPDFIRIMKKEHKKTVNQELAEIYMNDSGNVLYKAVAMYLEDGECVKEKAQS